MGKQYKRKKHGYLFKQKKLEDRIGRKIFNMFKDNFILSNDKIEFCFDAETGSITQIRDLETGKSFLSERTGARLFRLILPTSDWPTRYTDSNEPGNKPQIKAEEGHLELFYSEIYCRGENTGIQALVSVDLPQGAREAKFGIKLINGSNGDIQEVRFPWVGGFKSISGPGKDIITIASKTFDPHTFLPHKNPGTFLRVNQKYVFTYPYPLLLPYMDISGEGNGIGFICYLEKIRFGVIGFERLEPFSSNSSLSWAWASSPFIKPGQQWESPEVGVIVHTGDWHITANYFNTWLGKWWKPPAAPKSLKESIGLMNLQFTTFEGEKQHRFNEYPRLAKETMDAGIKHICIWHRAGGLYMMNGSTQEIMDEPAEVIEELRKALVETSKMGINTSIIMNFRLIKKIMEPYAEIAESEAMRSIDGSPASRESYSTSTAHLVPGFGPHYNMGDGVVMCERPQSIFAKRAEKLIAKMLDLGFDSIFIDQPLNVGCCFAIEHNHISPDAAPEESIKWMQEVSKQVKSHSKDSYVIGELPELFQTENADIWWYWDWRYIKPEIYRYSLPDSMQLWVIEDDVGELNKAFALGFYANLTPCGMETGISGVPAIAEQCRKLAFLRTETLNWTVYSRFVDKIGLLSYASEAYEIFVFKGKNRAAVIVAETRNSIVNVDIQFSPARLGLSFDEPGSVYSISKTEYNVSVTNKGIHSLSVDLKPYDVIVWTFGT